MSGLRDIAVPLKVVLGKTRVSVEEFASIGPGTVVELSALAGAPVNEAAVQAGLAAPDLPERIVEASFSGQRRARLEAAALIRQADRRMGTRRFGEALALLHRAQRLSGKHEARLLRRLGHCYLQLGRRAAAHKYLGQALKLDPHNGALKRAYQATR